jgi:hypothetical protein
VATRLDAIVRGGFCAARVREKSNDLHNCVYGLGVKRFQDLCLFCCLLEKLASLRKLFDVVIVKFNK